MADNNNFRNCFDLERNKILSPSMLYNLSGVFYVLVCFLFFYHGLLTTAAAQSWLYLGNRIPDTEMVTHNFQ